MSRLRPLYLVDHIILHSSGTPNGAWLTPEELDAQHCARGFLRDIGLAQHCNLKHIGYHYTINTRGAVTACRREDETSEHKRGYAERAIGICLFGTDAFLPAQWDALEKLIVRVKERCGISHIVGYSDISTAPQKPSPGFDVQTWIKGGLKPLQGHILEAQ